MASITINQMRGKILDAYPNASINWREKVTRMKTNQVVAIYRKIIEKEEEKMKDIKSCDDGFHQMDLWEWMISKKISDGKASGSKTLVEV